MLNFTIAGIITILILILVIIGVVFYAYLRVKNTVKDYSDKLFGTRDLKVVGEGLKGAIQSTNMEYDNTPKSVGGATGIYLPQIMKDFPEFDFDEAKHRAENVLISYLEAIDELKPSILSEGLPELREKLTQLTEGLKRDNIRQYFKGVQVHKTEISRYYKEKGRCIVVFESALQFIHYITKDGELIRGSRTAIKQTRFNVEYIYVQDRDFVEKNQGTGTALNCPNCGGPLPSLGAKICPYCDSPVVAFNIKTWNFSDVKEV
ncbi:MAG: zinc ribbon domain-containing protein [Lachnospiraceae bacterium]|nr:zinc ribbon domain-containing protein [Lachnospiraceae bacterium]